MSGQTEPTGEHDGGEPDEVQTAKMQCMGIASVAILAAVVLTAILYNKHVNYVTSDKRTLLTSDGMIVKGVQAVKIPELDLLSVPSVGWLQDSRLWVKTKQHRMVASPPYKTFAVLPFSISGPVIPSPDGLMCALPKSIGKIDPVLAWSASGKPIALWTTPHSSLYNWWKRDGSGIFSLVGSGTTVTSLLFTPVSTRPDLKPIDTPIHLKICADNSDNYDVGDTPDGKLFVFDRIGYTGILDPSTNTPVQTVFWQNATNRHIEGLIGKSISPEDVTDFVADNDRLIVSRDQAAIAPGGKRLAWICDVDDLEDKNVRIHEQASCELHICDLNGDNEHFIAWVPGIFLHVTDQEPPLHDLQWLPDGKSVSVVYQGKLYIIPVE